MSTIELKHLKLIKVIAETGNLSKSAKRLNKSQPALSRQLLNLEDRLGAALFIRSHKAMVLTDIGMDILEMANEVIEKVDHFEKKIASKLKGDIGELRIGVHCVFCFNWLPALVEQFHGLFPEVELEINSCLNCIRDLQRLRADIVITPFPMREDFIQYVPLFSDDFIMISTPGHPLSAKKEIQPSDFKSENYLTPVPKAHDPVYNIFLKPDGIEPKKYMLVSQTEALIELVKAGIGLSAFPRWAVLDIIRRGELGSSPLKNPHSKATWYAARRINQFHPDYQNEFVRMVKRHVGDSCSAGIDLVCQ